MNFDDKNKFTMITESITDNLCLSLTLYFHKGLP